MKRIWLLALSSLLLLGGASCSATSRPLVLKVQADKTVYQSGEVIAMALTVLNLNREPVQLSFASSQVFDFWLADGDQTVWKWSTGRFFTQALSKLTLKPGQPVTYVAKMDPDAAAALKPGTYRLVGELKTKEKLVAKPVEIRITDPAR
ncbi:intracellular proteinase inhibitor BsuPI [Hydrogenispora ethanolica]|uniref:Intracellular proteinase inhibitor BsuPI n=1 Tax=Hydrogenispora ethanolica TaxID=1082276 RepID=A0A4R1RMC7_HYDET|nr:BsuPI-related putative proteinase inhibitor [Hydrogenispora ethanolica]TCL67344.1 intracellular proteinase inhibitor BsuPI [Hydrogenispora ethanolica]